MTVWTNKSTTQYKNYIVIRHPIKGLNTNIGGVRFRDGYGVVEKDSKTYFHLKKIPAVKKFTEYPLDHLLKLKFITRKQDVKLIYGSDVYIKLLSYLKEKEHNEELIKLREKQVDTLQRIEEDKQRKENLKEKIELDKKLDELKEVTKQTREKIKTEKSEEAKEELKNILKERREIVKEKKKFTQCCYLNASGFLCRNEANELSPSNYCTNHIINDPKLINFGLEKQPGWSRQQKKEFRKKVIEKLSKLKQRGLL